MARTQNLGINPLPWILVDMSYNLDRDVLTRAMKELGGIGFDHITVEIPDGLTPRQYGALLSDNGFSPAPGYFSGRWSDHDSHAGLVEALKVHAAAHAELGLDRAFIAHDLVPERIARPAVGVAADPFRLAVIADGLALAAEAGVAEGVRYALHPHVGSWIETEEETRSVLDTTAGSDLFFGPDTGHLYWAGADPAALMRSYSDRIIAVHLKDVNMSARDTAIAKGDEYRAATVVRHVWTEPGQGAIDFEEVFKSLPAAFDGWFVIEVDVPDAASAVESSAISLAFVNQHPYFAPVTA
ncbi:sugar phosphate isomerase/epimerase [Subtercola frigoramans]